MAEHPAKGTKKIKLRGTSRRLAKPRRRVR